MGANSPATLTSQHKPDLLGQTVVVIGGSPASASKQLAERAPRGRM